MNDCPNADVRDLLPDLLAARLNFDARRLVEAHVAGCAECQAELALLRDMHASLLVRTPALDLSAIVAAIPTHRVPARRSWVSWRTAAAITMVAAGGSSALILSRGVSTIPPDSLAVRPAPVRAAAPPPAPVVASANPLAGATVHVPTARSMKQNVVSPPVELAVQVAGDAHELAMTGGTMTDLSDKELATLLKDIEKMDAMPAMDGESATISPLSPRRSPR